MVYVHITDVRVLELGFDERTFGVKGSATVRCSAHLRTTTLWILGGATATAAKPLNAPTLARHHGHTWAIVLSERKEQTLAHGRVPIVPSCSQQVLRPPFSPAFPALPQERTSRESLGTLPFRANPLHGGVRPHGSPETDDRRRCPHIHRHRGHSFHRRPTFDGWIGQLWRTVQLWRVDRLWWIDRLGRNHTGTDRRWYQPMHGKQRLPLPAGLQHQY